MSSGGGAVPGRVRSGTVAGRGRWSRPRLPDPRRIAPGSPIRPTSLMRSIGVGVRDARSIYRRVGCPNLLQRPGSGRSAGRESLIFRAFILGRSGRGTPLQQIWTRPAPGRPRSPTRTTPRPPAARGPTRLRVRPTPAGRRRRRRGRGRRPDRAGCGSRSIRPSGRPSVRASAAGSRPGCAGRARRCLRLPALSAPHPMVCGWGPGELSLMLACSRRRPGSRCSASASVAVARRSGAPHGCFSGLDGGLVVLPATPRRSLPPSRRFW